MVTDDLTGDEWTIDSLKPGETMLSSNPSLQNYLVDPDGYIDFPSLGRIKAAGLTRSQLEQYIKKELEPMVTDPIVKVQILTNNITVLGEVTAPGTFEIPNERLSLFEALGLAKDLTIYARRDSHHPGNRRRETDEYAGRPYKTRCIFIAGILPPKRRCRVCGTQ